MHVEFTYSARLLNRVTMSESLWGLLCCLTVVDVNNNDDEEDEDEWPVFTPV